MVYLPVFFITIQLTTIKLVLNAPPINTVLKLRGLSVLTKPTNHSDESVININLTEGSDVQCKLLTMNSLLLTQSRLLYPFHRTNRRNRNNFRNITIQMKHMFKETGNYQLKVKCWNTINVLQKTFSVTIENPIVNLTLISPKYNTVLEVNKTFSICYQVKSGSHPHFIVLPTYNDVIKSTRTCLSYHYRLLDYFKSGEVQLKLIISIKAYNNVSSTRTSTIVMLQKPVIGLQVSSMSCLVAKTNETSVIKLLIDEGSDFECTWREELQGIRVSEEREYIYYKNGDLDMRNYRNIVKLFKANFHLAGSYLIHTNCRNRLSNFTMSTFCQVQDRIGDLIINDIKTQTIGLPSHISWKLVSGTNVTYTVYFNNIKLTPVDDRFTNAIIPTGMVTSPGHYKGSIIATNRITSNFTKTFEVIFEQVLTEFNISITYVDENGKKRSGHGEKNSIFPSQTNLYFSLDKFFGGCYCTWGFIVNNSDVGNKDDTFNRREFRHTFSYPGTVTVRYVASNNVSLVTGQRKFVVMETVGRVNFVINPSKTSSYVIIFTIETSQKGNQSCFSFSPGDKTRYFFNTYHGNCRIFNESFGLFSGIFHSNTSRFDITHTYVARGLFIAELLVLNMFSKPNYVTKSVSIQEVGCDQPVIEIENLPSTSSKATEHAKSLKMTAYLNINMSCDYTSKHIYQWTLFEVDEINNKRNFVKLNDSFYNFNPYVQKDFIIKGNALDYGIYVVQITVFMATSTRKEFQASTRGYLRIISSPLEVVIKGGSFLQRGWGGLVRFQGAMSRDPDVQRGTIKGLSTITLSLQW